MRNLDDLDRLYATIADDKRAIDIVLKLLISRKHGSLIAAPTFSLPETIGGVLH